ncbi:MAG: hypothetical protein P8R54_10660 [Myxococcota bacterium]|nr:hypothetical protein [Myxococcota bacterium]
MILTTLLIPLAAAMDVTLTMDPAPDGLHTETIQCTVTDVKKGELLALPTLTIGGSEVSPMVEIGSVGPWGVVWQSALRVVTGGDDAYPGLVSIARPARTAAAQGPCPIGVSCVHTFDRAEQSLRLSIEAAGSAPGSAEPAELIWRTTSWYREARAVACAVPTN